MGISQEISKICSNDEQRAAYECDSSCVVLAGPGSGKTALLTLKFVDYAKKVKAPRGVGCITFNNDAALEFTTRIASYSVNLTVPYFLGTVHSFCFRHILKPFGTKVLEGFPEGIKVASVTDLRACENVAKDAIGVGFLPYDVRDEYLNHRRVVLDRTSQEWEADSQCVAYIEAYENALRVRGLVDFDDQVILSYRILETSGFARSAIEAKFPYLLIDEYQDLSPVLHRIVKLLHNRTNIVFFVVGDPDQSIYDFLGADPQYLFELAELDGFSRFFLATNYRCGPNIINISDRFLNPSQDVRYKACEHTDYEGEIQITHRPCGIEDQCRHICTDVIPSLRGAGIEDGEIGILYIDRFDCSYLTAALDDAGIKYSGEKDLRYDRSPLVRWLESIAQWLCEASQHADFLNIYRMWLGFSGVDEGLSSLTTFHQAVRGLPEVSSSLSTWLDHLITRLDLISVLSRSGEYDYEVANVNSIVAKSSAGNLLSDFTVEDFAGCGPNQNQITLTTMHSSKGRQFDAVILPGIEQGRIPRYNATETGTMFSRRLFYVSLTRARKHLRLLYSGWYAVNGHQFNNGPSQFLAELQ